MDEKSAFEDLQYIRKIMDETRKNIAYNGLDYIFWGVLVTVAMLTQYTLAVSRMRFNYIWLWIIAIGIGWIFSIYNGRKHCAKGPQTYASKLLSSVWFAAGFAMTLVAFVGVGSGSFRPWAISPILSGIIGAAYFISGKIAGSRWTTNLSFGWWSGSIILFFVKDINQFLIMSSMMLLFQTIPGIIMYRTYKKEMA